MPSVRRPRAGHVQYTKEHAARHLGWVDLGADLSLADRAGYPAAAFGAQELLGHATIQMTMRYAHLSPEIACDAVQMLDGAAV